MHVCESRPYHESVFAAKDTKRMDYAYAPNLRHPREKGECIAKKISSSTQYQTKFVSGSCSRRLVISHVKAMRNGAIFLPYVHRRFLHLVLVSGEVSDDCGHSMSTKISCVWVCFILS